MSNLIRYFLLLRLRFGKWTDAAVFAPQWSNAAATVRLCFCFASLLIFTAWLDSLTRWVGVGGPLTRDVTSFLIGEGLEDSGAAFRVSPLYATDQPVWLNAYLVGGVIASLVAMSGFGGRLSLAVLWLWLLGLLHRVAPIQSHGEILVSTFMPYLLIDQGWLAHPSRVGFSDDQRRWTVRLMLALMRCHLIIWLAMSLAFHLGQSIWWDGTAPEVIASMGNSLLFGPTSFSGSPWFATILANSWLLLHVATIAALCLSRAAVMATILSTIFWLGGWVWTGDWLYAVGGLAVSSCLYFDASLEWKTLRRPAAGSPAAASTASR